MSDITYYNLIYGKLNCKQQNDISMFLYNMFGDIDFGFDYNTIIILSVLERKIIGCIFLLENSFLKNKLKNNDIILDNYCLIENKKGVFLYNLAVDSLYRKQSIATTLINKALEISKKYHIDYVHTYPQNTISKYIFTKLEFKQCDNIKNMFYKNL
jgi:ribosomal protein S18 acetylase RimI-like enzyme